MKLTNYNEFDVWIRWHDYVSVIVNEFPVVLVRRYYWHDVKTTTLMIQVLGYKLLQTTKDMI